MANHPQPGLESRNGDVDCGESPKLYWGEDRCLEWCLEYSKFSVLLSLYHLGTAEERALRECHVLELNL